jgi:hypothetical protein
MFEIYKASGVDYVYVEANIDVGGYTWARQGFDWDPKHMTTWDLRFTLDSMNGDIKSSIMRNVPEDQRAALIRKLDKLIPDQEYDPEGWDGPDALAMDDIPDGTPTPYEISQFGKDTFTWYEDGKLMWPGKAGMLGSRWYGRYSL